jgi:hypothetical protein
VAFERGSTKAVVAMDDYTPAAVAVIEHFAVLQQSVILANAVEIVEHKVRVRLPNIPFPIQLFPEGSRDTVGLFFVSCPFEIRASLVRELRTSAVSFDTSKSSDLALIQLFDWDEAASFADLEQLPGSCSLAGGIVIDEVFWSDRNGNRGWRRPGPGEQINWDGFVTDLGYW